MLSQAERRTPARALIVEDDRALRALMCGYLRREGFDVVEAGDGVRALALLRDSIFEIALVDLGLPALDGLELVRRVRRVSMVPIILVTGRGEVTSRVEGLRAGGDDYMVKPFSMAEVVERARALLRRARGFRDEQTVLSTGSVRLDLDARRCVTDAEEVALTRGEFDLLATFLRHPGRIQTREQLLERVWDDAEITERTVDVHVAALRRKLGRAVRIATLRGVGHRLEPGA
jgi:DNA-binding response OmpR family regulator